MRGLSLVRTEQWMVATMLLSTMACGGAGDSAPAEEHAEHDAMMDTSSADSEASMATPSVFFVSPHDGQTVSAAEPVAFEFGIDGYDIGAVPEEVEHVRPGVGHFHLGVDTECLPAGELIPKADPWIHFGDASNTIEMMLEPGEHHFALQVGDDEHRTVDGLCQTISITVE